MKKSECGNQIDMNITNLIGTMVIIDGKENKLEQIQEKVTEALLKALSKVQNVETK